MAEFLERVANARERVSPKWTPGRERELRFRVERGLDRRRTTIRALGGVALAVAALFLGHTGYRQVFGNTHIVAQAPLRHDVRNLFELTDGTRVTALSTDARVEPVEVSREAVRVRLEAGGAHFDVAHVEGRHFQVQARDVLVTVLGTAFSVAVESGGVRVEVERGRVDVGFDGQHRILGAGERIFASEGAFRTGQSAPRSAASAEVPAIEPVPPVEPSSEAPNSNAPSTRRAPAAAPSSWRTLAQDGDYRSAFERMQAEGSNAVRDEPGDLLFAADVARLSGHAALALPLLERVLRGHPHDSRAPLAAFTLGRTLLDSLGRPREAADAFGKARRLSPNGALAQDALAREVESWSRAGESVVARQRALEYLERYPGGRREKAVRYHGGLE
ncbi:MAG TPA: FecR domain-containing protein [Polyangiaceae bacterium]|nr:FecR domain-containing protein [Polyangiaceae bacterium]